MIQDTQLTSTNFEKRYAKLNVAQKKAVDTIEGPVMVIAGPGTGKTEILTMRIAQILRAAGAGIAPENILALTFTNAGVSAMRERLTHLIGAQTAYRVGIYTFHSFCEEQMSRYPDFFPDFAYARAIADMDRLRMIEKIVAEGDFVTLKTFASEHHFTKSIIGAIEELKREGVTPEDFDKRIAQQEKDYLADENSYYKKKYKNFAKGDLKPTALAPVEKNRELARVYETYQEQLRTQKLYDFSDMVIAVVEAMEQSDAFHATLLEQYQYILVDEHQDTNDGQNRLLELLTETPTGDVPNLFTVGDDKQAIYRFQGASVENFLHFSEAFTDIVTINLTKNYRSTQQILDVSHALISSEEGEREHVALRASGGAQHVSIDVHAFGAYTDELAFVARDIRTKIDAGHTPNEIAVMYLQNAHLADIKAALERESVPYTISSRENLLHDPEMRKLFLLLRATADPMNAASMGQALLIDFFGCDLRDVLLLFDASRYGKKTRSLFHLMTTDRLRKSEEFVDRAAIEKVAAFFMTQKSAGENMPFLVFFETFVRESGFLAHVMSKPAHVTHLRQLDTLMGEIRTQMQTKPAYRLCDFLQYIETLMTYDLTINVPGASHEAGVQLMTAHGSKGLEFESVYITNAVHKLWDHKRARNIFKLPINTSVSDINDERRLFYVALTRAKSDVTITHAARDLQGREKTPTLFINELNTEHITAHDHTEDTHDDAQIFRQRTQVLPHILDAEYIREKFLSTQLSVSALNNYMKSPLIYFFRNLIRLPQAQTKSLLFGNVVHAALEKYFDRVAEEKKVIPQKHLQECFDQALTQEFLLAEYFEEIEKRGHATLQNYWQQYKDDFHTDLMTEKKVKAIPFTLDDGTEILLHGIIDKLEILEGGDVRVIDYKTGRPWSKKSKEDKMHLERQIVFYKLLLDGFEDRDGKTYNMTQGVLEFVEPNDKGEYEREVFTVTKAQVDTLKAEINTFAKDILNGTLMDKDFPRTRDTAQYLDLLEVLKKSK